MDPEEFFSVEEIASVEKAIEEAEKNTSGEICVHIDKYCSGDPVEKAKLIFELRELHKTKFRNAVLFYLSVEDHKYAIWGDKAINEAVEDGFWDEMSQVMLENFKGKKFVQGLSVAISITGKKLKKYFPYEQKGALNEVTNELSFGKGE